jgi:hypothetical protein
MSLSGHFVAAAHDDGDPVTGHYYETASNDPARPQAWCFTDRLSYAPGDRLTLHAIAHEPAARLTIARDGLAPQIVLDRLIPAGFAPTPPDCAVAGCGWPERFALTIPADWATGLYRITIAAGGAQSDHMVVLRPARPAARCLFLLTTGTWAAYNDWGGSNHYQGLTGPRGTDFAPQVSLLRPWARGFVRWPADAPRIPHGSPPLTRPRYPHMEFARARGVSKKYASSGWAAFERPFALWCEGEGITLDYATQHDLHRDPALLQGYRRAVIVGHDEYWTREMRDHLDAWIADGGELARFAGNIFWQTRLSADGLTQTCFKARARAEDPLAGTDRITSYWDDPRTGRPASLSLGLTGAIGIYAGWSRCAAQGAGGFTIYRPGHWTLAGTGLGYGDVLGRDSRIFGYEVDGIDYVMTGGLPYPAAGAALEGELTIVALSPATALAHATGPGDADTFIGTGDAAEVAAIIHSSTAPEVLDLVSRGNGCLADYRRGRGRVVNAASCEWVAGLIARDPQVETVTRRLLSGAWPR